LAPSETKSATNSDGYRDPAEIVLVVDQIVPGDASSRQAQENADYQAEQTSKFCERSHTANKANAECIRVGPMATKMQRGGLQASAATTG